MPVIDHHALVEKNKKLSEENKRLKGFAGELINEAFNFCSCGSEVIIEVGEKHGLIKNNKKTFK